MYNIFDTVNILSHKTFHLTSHQITCTLSATINNSPWDVAFFVAMATAALTAGEDALPSRCNNEGEKFFRRMSFMAINTKKCWGVIPGHLLLFITFLPRISVRGVGGKVCCGKVQLC